MLGLRSFITWLNIIGDRTPPNADIQSLFISAQPRFSIGGRILLGVWHHALRVTDTVTLCSNDPARRKSDWACLVVKRQATGRNRFTDDVLSRVWMADTPKCSDTMECDRESWSCLISSPSLPNMKPTPGTLGDT